MNNWNELLTCWLDTGCQVATLYNHSNIPVGAIYLNQVDTSKLVITKLTDVDEQYYLYFNGIAIFFSFIRKN